MTTLFVERTVEIPAEAQRLLNDAREVLHIRDVQSVRLVHRYLVEGVTPAVLTQAERTIFSDPATDQLSHTLQVEPGETAFAYAYVPGQFDNRAQAAVDALHVLGAADPIVLVATVVVLAGPVTPEELRRLKGYLINPVDSEEVDPYDAATQLRRARAATERRAAAGTQSPDRAETAGAATRVVPIRHLAEAAAGIEPEVPGRAAAAPPVAATEVVERLGLAMTADDLLACAAAFAREGREPRLIELRLLDTYWSDHCRHQTFLTELTEVTVPRGSAEAHALQRYRELRRQLDRGDRPETLMDMATIVAKAFRARGELGDLDVSEEINAAGIILPGGEVDGAAPEGKSSAPVPADDDWLLLFKNETHNHPTEIEPYGGASTCLGGAIRDPMSGRGTVFQALRVSGSGDPRQPVEETRPGKLPQRLITLEAARGFSSYGNQFGLATGLVGEHYHPGYVAKRLEAGAVLGAVPRRFLRRERPEPGDLVLLVGGRTGRDGIGGATGSSREHTEDSVAVAGAEVQKGNPPAERALYRLYRNPDALALIKRCNDFGAGGVAVAVGELAAGIDIDLDAVPRKYEHLAPDEVALSESQERMAVVVAPDHAAGFRKLAAEENLEATVIARITEGARLVMRSRGVAVVDLPRSLLDSAGAPKRATAEIAPHRATPSAAGAARGDGATTTGGAAGREAWLRHLQSLTGAAHRGLVERFDSSIGRGTVLLPFGGVFQRTPAQATVMRLPRFTEGGEASVAVGADLVSVAAYGFSPTIAEGSPYGGGYLAVVEAVCRAVAAGCDPRRVRLSLQEYFPRPGSEPRRWGLPVAALLGALAAQLDLGTPAIGGKDSMSGTFEDLDVPPTLIAFAFGPGREAHVRSPELKAEGNRLVLLRPEREPAGDIPEGEELRHILHFLHDAAGDDGLLSVAAVGEDGLAGVLTRATFGNHIGITINRDAGDSLDWFAPGVGDFLLEVTPRFFEQRLRRWGIAVEIGSTGGKVIALQDWELPIADAFAAWHETLEPLFRSGEAPGATGTGGTSTTTTEQAARAAQGGPGGTGAPADAPRSTPRAVPAGARGAHGVAGARGAHGAAAPRVLIPVFPGTNCEYDSAEAVREAGGRPHTIVLRTMNRAAIEDSLDQLAGALAESQIMLLPGGFSAGDEPDGSGKFMAALLRMPRVAAEIERLVQDRDGLILGICNGFQALVRLGLVPYGEIRERSPGDPVLAQNRIGHHVARMAWTRIASSSSPWLAETGPGDVYAVPVSHGEGRLLMDATAAQRLLDAGQVATQYADPSGAVADAEPWNPNGSVLAIEGITSPDGRIFGKMGHIERIAPGLFRNHPTPGNAGIIESGVRYFR